jgi:putative protease
MNMPIPNADPARRPGGPELLAPAGSQESLNAAVANGADAVYFGLESFNARQRAANFKLSELPKIVAHLHARNVRAYITFNTLLFSDELPQAAHYAESIARAGADAVIVQDLGLAQLIRCLAPTLPIHASTQTTQTEPRGIEFLRSIGLSRVILARELSLAEIEQIGRRTSMPLEVFVHGAICISYSGQCLASESLWGRSANRGMCGQACRLPYQLVVDGQPQDAADRQYILSAQDLSALDRLPELIKLGVARFKIEGRLKNEQYVAAATSAYRSAIDAITGSTPATADGSLKSDLALSFSRGLCHGFLGGVDHQQLVHGRFPKSRGLYIGTVVDRTSRGIIVRLDSETKSRKASPPAPRETRQQSRPGGSPPTAASLLKPGDGVVFDEGHPEQDEQGGRVFSVDPAGRATRPSAKSMAPSHDTARRTPNPSAGESGASLIELSFGRDAVNLAAIQIGCKVWKTDDPAIRRRLARGSRSDRPARRVPLHAHVTAACDGLLAIVLSDDDGHEARATWDQPLRPAEKHPLTVDLLRQQLDRLGDTPFELASVELLGPSGPADSLPVMVPKSVLNDLRRQAVQSLLDQRAAASLHEIADVHALESIRESIPRHFEQAGMRNDGLSDTASSPRLHILARTFDQFEAILAWTPPTPAVQPGSLYCDFDNMTDATRAAAQARNAIWSVGLATPRILMPGEERFLEAIAAAAPKSVLIRNLGSLDFFRRQCPGMTLIGDFSLNIANELTALLLAEKGLARLTPSYDLNWRQLSALSRQFPPAFLEVVLHQHVPMFHTRHCLFAALRTDATSCADCDRPCTRHELHLRDRNGADHPVLVDAAGRNTVFTAAIQAPAESAPEMLQASLRHFRIELLRESPQQTGDLLDIYAALLAGTLTPPAALRQLRKLTPAPVTRGIFSFE